MRQHQEHIPAKRQIRFAQATSQLSDADADTRLAGALALIELADEWLTTPAADQITSKHPNPNQPAREAQAIIHELCAYIRSPFPAGSASSRTELAQHYMRLLNDAPRRACPARSVSSFRRRNPPWRLRRWYAGASLRLSMTDSCRSQTTALPRAPGAPPICRRRRAAGGRGWIMIFRVPYFSTRCC